MTRSQLKEFVAADTPVELAAERSKLSSCRNHGAGPNAVPRAGRPRGCSEEEKSKPQNGLGENFTLAQAEFERIEPSLFRATLQTSSTSP